jgi:hypothetical protein
MVTILGRDWGKRLEVLLVAASENLVISSPYISHEGAEFVTSVLRTCKRRSLRASILTDLSPVAVAQGANDPSAVVRIAESFEAVDVRHLAHLHAKVYVADAARAIVTSGNLTGGGLHRNYELGVEVLDPDWVGQARTEILDYASLGAEFGDAQLRAYAEQANEVRRQFGKAQASITRSARRKLEASIQGLGDEVIRRQLGGESVHSVFSRAIVYVLKRYGAMDTRSLQLRVRAILPELCDDSVDRVIDGEHYGKKWKHQLRSAQSGLKRKGWLELRNRAWRLVTQGQRP